MPVQIGAKPLAGFEQPLEMLADCHRRVEHFLDSMLQVAATFRGKPLDEAGRRVLQSARDYFATSAPKHTADEEDSLFPRMLASSELTPEVREAIAELQAEHAEANKLHARIDESLVLWLNNQQPLTSEIEEQLRADLQQIRAHYAQHIQCEEITVFPAARLKLRLEAIRDIGNEMKQRRGLN